MTEAYQIVENGYGITLFEGKIYKTKNDAMKIMKERGWLFDKNRRVWIRACSMLTSYNDGLYAFIDKVSLDD